MFEVEKPRQFHYEPRFYDPEKEKWEALKHKYDRLREPGEEKPTETTEASDTGDADLEYFEKKVREIDRQRLEESHKLTWQDLFRKRQMPKFNYQPRFDTAATEENPTDATSSSMSAEGAAIMQRMRKRKMSRRFDMDDVDYFKPISGGKIIMYVIVAFLLLLWILL